MEREIKFKAKKLSDGSWVSGYYYQECGNTYIIENRQNGSDLNRNHPYKVDPSTVCQYTGEKDMDGEDIYVGDIISNIETGSVMEIVWNGRLKRLDCNFLNGAKNGLVPFGPVVTKYKHIVVLMSKFDKEV